MPNIFLIFLIGLLPLTGCTNNRKEEASMRAARSNLQLQDTTTIPNKQKEEARMRASVYRNDYDCSNMYLWPKSPLCYTDAMDASIEIISQILDNARANPNEVIRMWEIETIERNTNICINNLLKPRNDDLSSKDYSANLLVSNHAKKCLGTIEVVLKELSIHPMNENARRKTQELREYIQNIFKIS